jgi:plasmid maintenance system antidote protein VapI
MYDTSAEVLDALRVKLRAHSDREIARRLDVTHTTVQHWRTGRSAMSPEVAIRAAELLGVPPELLLLRRYAELERSEDARRIVARIADGLQRAARKAGKAAALAGLAVAASTGIVAPAPSQAATGDSGSGMYILLNRRRRPWSAALGIL